MNPCLEKMGELKINIVSLNTRGLGNKMKRIAVFNWLRKKFRDCIILLQETHSVDKVEKQWQDEWGSNIEFCHGTKQSRGVAILFPKSINVNVLNKEVDDVGRMLLLSLSIEEQPYTICNIYAPTKDCNISQLAFYDYISDVLSLHLGENLILGGDFNVCPYPDKDKQDGRPEQKSKSALKLSEIKEYLGLTDIWRILNEDKRRYTWRGKSKSGYVASRIDYFLISLNLVSCTVECDILPSLKSDHSAIALSLRIPQSKSKGRGYWKFNVSLLKDEVYVAKINNFFERCTNRFGYLEDKGQVWDIVKCEIRGITIKYTSNKKKVENFELENLNKQLQILETLSDQDKNFRAQYETVRDRICEIEEIKARGCMIRSRANWIEYGEKPSSYFLNLEKRNSKNKSMNVLISDSNVLDKQDDIKKACLEFYQHLYAKRDIESNLDNCPLLNIEHPVLNDENQLQCEGIISSEECALGLSQLANNKSPGIDGIPIDFYKFFWLKIKPLLLASYIYALESEQLSLDQRRAVLTLIPKGDKDTRHIKNWRPLSLLNSDYKIFAKVLSNRLQKVIPNLIHPNQVGYIKGRFIGDNIRTMLDILELSSRKNDPGIIVLIDFLKAFDSISWDFLHKTLDFFNFGEIFKSYVKILYSKPLCCIAINGHHTEFFELGRGVRQGCPISALLFILCVEILSLNIRQNEHIEGIQLSTCELKLSQYADDTCLYLKDLVSLDRALDTFEEFYRYAGLKLNKDKTEMIWLGKNNRDGKYSNICFTNKPVKVLGIWVCKDLDKVIDINIDERLSKFKTLLNMWKQRILTLKGKITILNTQALPLLLYAAAFLYMSKERILEIERIMFNFIWPNGKHHIKKLTLIEEIANGGLKMPDIESKIYSMKFMSVKRMIVNNDNCYATTKHIIKNMNLNTFFAFKNEAKHLNNIPLYYRQLLEIWNLLHNHEPDTVTEIISETLWNNTYIQIDGKPICYNKWLEKGILYVSDIVDRTNADGFKSVEQLFIEHGIECNFLTYLSLKSAIPQRWINIIRNSLVYTGDVDKNIYVYLDCKLQARNVTCKDVYKYLISKKSKKPTSNYSWEAEFFYKYIDWSEIYCIPYRCIRETSIQSLQYKIINNFYPCQTMLYLWGKSDTNTCLHCDSIDTIRHHFADCPRARQFWTNLQRWIGDKLQVNIPLTPFEILLGIPNSHLNEVLDLINFLVLCGKYYIYIQNRTNTALNELAFLNIVKERVKIEKYIYIMLGKADAYNLKWLELERSLN